MLDSLLRISKKKLLIYGLIFVFILFAFGSVTAAKLGYFPSLAKVLDIKADTAVNFSSVYTVCNSLDSSINGQYNKTNGTNGIPTFVKDASHSITAISFPGQNVVGSFWSLNGQYWRACNSTQDTNVQTCLTKDLVDQPAGSAQWGPAWGINRTDNITVKAGALDPATCQPVSTGSIQGKITAYMTGGVQGSLDGVLVTVKKSDGTVAGSTTSTLHTTTAPTDVNYTVSNLPLNVSYTVTATKSGFTSSPVSQTTNSSNPVGGSINLTNFFMNSNVTPPPAGTLTVALAASPNQGTAPMNNVALTATVSGTVTGNISYSFYCRDTDVNPTSNLFDSPLTSTTSQACSYATVGSYSPKVVVTRAGLFATATASVTVSAPVPATFDLVGKVIDSSTQKPIPNGKVALTIGGHWTQTITDKNGSYSFVDLELPTDPARSITLDFSAPGYKDKQRTILCSVIASGAAGGTYNLGTTKLDPAATSSLVVFGQVLVRPLSFKYNYDPDKEGEIPTNMRPPYSISLTLTSDRLPNLSSQLMEQAGDPYSFDDLKIIDPNSENVTVKAKILINADGYKPYEENFTFKTKDLKSNGGKYYLYKDFNIETIEKDNYEICLHVKDSKGTGLEQARVLVKFGNVPVLREYSDFSTGSIYVPYVSNGSSDVTFGIWSLRLGDVPREISKNGISFFIVPLGKEDSSMPLARSLYLSADDLNRVALMDSDWFGLGGRPICQQAKSSFENPVFWNAYEVNYLDAETGLPVDLAKETGISTEIDYLDSSNKDETMPLVDWKISADTKNLITYRVRKTDDNGFGKRVQFSSDNYIMSDLTGELRNNVFPAKIYLIRKTQATKAMVCLSAKDLTSDPTLIALLPINFGMLKVTFDQLSPTDKQNMLKMAQMVTSLRNQAGDSKATSIYIQTPPHSRGWASKWNDLSQFGCVTSTYVSLDLSDIKEFDAETFIHEFFHTLDFYHDVSNKNTYQFDNITINGNTENARQLMDQFNCCGSKGFPDFTYAERTNNLELWAQFTTWWFLHNDKYKQAIADDSPLSAECRMVLKFMYAVLSQEYPDLKPYQAKQPVSRLDQNELKIILASVSDSTAMDKIMNDQGFVPSQKLNIATIKPLTSLVLTKDQIIAGNWLQSKYNTLTPVQKATVQLNVLKSQVFQWVNTNKNVSYIRTQIVALTSTVESWLSKLGFNFSASKLTGTLRDQNGKVVPRFQITVGNSAGKGKIDITDSTGAFSVLRLPTGSQVITITDPSNNKVYTPFDYATKAPISSLNVVVNTNYTKNLIIKK